MPEPVAPGPRSLAPSATGASGGPVPDELTAEGTAPGTTTADGERRYWINTVSLDHVEAAARGGFTQADHGAGTRLRRPQPGEEMVFYWPRTTLHAGAPVRQFTAWVTITGEEPYQAWVSEDFQPWRLAAQFHLCQLTEAKPLVEHPSFISDATHWGLLFRRGLFTIPGVDFQTILAAMTRS